MSTHDHYVVRNVLLTPDGSAGVTLDPIIWFKEQADPESDDLDDASPDDPDAKAMKVGGRATELRFEDDLGFRPGDFVSLGVSLVHKAGDRPCE